MTARARAKGMLLFAVTFAAGVVSGAEYERRTTPSHDAARVGSHHVMQRLKDDLALDSVQERAIAAILARRQGMVDSTWHAMQPHVHATLDSTLQEIVEVLRPDQAAKYRKMVEAKHPGTMR